MIKWSKEVTNNSGKTNGNRTRCFIFQLCNKNDKPAIEPGSLRCITGLCDKEADGVCRHLVVKGTGLVHIYYLFVAKEIGSILLIGGKGDWS